MDETNRRALLAAHNRNTPLSPELEKTKKSITAKVNADTLRQMAANPNGGPYQPTNAISTTAGAYSLRAPWENGDGSADSVLYPNEVLPPEQKAGTTTVTAPPASPTAPGGKRYFTNLSDPYTGSGGVVSFNGGARAALAPTKESAAPVFEKNAALGITPQNETENALLKMLPTRNHGSGGLSSMAQLGAFRGAVNAIAGLRQKEDKEAGENYRAKLSAYASAKTPEELAKLRAETALKQQEFEQSELGVNFKSAMDESGNPIAGGLITMKEYGLAVKAEDWTTVQQLAAPNGELTKRLQEAHPQATSRELNKLAYKYAMMQVGNSGPTAVTKK
jgi:hypothetical protein